MIAGRGLDLAGNSQEPAQHAPVHLMIARDDVHDWLWRSGGNNRVWLARAEVGELDGRRPECRAVASGWLGKRLAATASEANFSRRHSAVALTTAVSVSPIEWVARSSASLMDFVGTALRG